MLPRTHDYGRFHLITDRGFETLGRGNGGGCVKRVVPCTGTFRLFTGSIYASSGEKRGAFCSNELYRTMNDKTNFSVFCSTFPRECFRGEGLIVPRNVAFSIYMTL